MKKRTIWIIAITMGVCFLALLWLQRKYFVEITRIRQEQFETSVCRSLNRVAHMLEIGETMKALKEDYFANENDTIKYVEDSTEEIGVANSPLPKSTSHFVFSRKDSISKLNVNTSQVVNHTSFILRNQTRKSMYDLPEKIKRNIEAKYFHHRALLDKVVYNILYSAYEIPLKDRIDFKKLDSHLKEELFNNGIYIPYHFSVTTRNGDVLYKCSDYTDEGNEYVFKQVLFPNNTTSNTAILCVHFPEMSNYIFRSVQFFIPAFLFTLILVVLFVYSVFIIFRQKRLSELKNDFINNMTHELKTPIASISLAVQMLVDTSITKSEQMTTHLSGIINEETKRLQMLIEKVLQTSIFEGQKVSYKNVELDINELVAEISNSFELKVQKIGGIFEADIDPNETIIFGDKMHITNVISNLMDNAMKYRRDNTEFHLHVTTKTTNSNISIIIEDNGIGIKKEDIKKIFDKFYRVHTGNRHDVKGFGLGLAYVKGIVTNMHGNIRVESEYGHGTKMIIQLPIIKN